MKDASVLLISILLLSGCNRTDKQTLGGVIWILIILAVIFWIAVTIIHQRKTINEYKEKQKEYDDIEIERKKLAYQISEAEEESSKLTREAEARKAEIEAKTEEIKDAFSTSFIRGRQWLADMIAEANASVDDARSKILYYKKNPAKKASDDVKKIGKEKRELQRKLTFLEYQLKSYKEYFPFLEEYEEAILEEVDGITNVTEDDASSVDTVYKYLSPEEYQKLSTTQRNQLALDRYIQRHKSKYEIGRLYEMFIGHLYEKAGWHVQYFGIQKQKEDMGRDLICDKENETLIVQVKNWSQSKRIYEKHIFQLFGTTFEYRKKHPKRKITPIFITSTNLSDVARNAARLLKIKVKENIPLETSFPMIKCNIGRNGEKIYHLPFDQMYNYTIIDKRKGEFYAYTVAEAEASGFRRAMKHIPYSN